MCLLFLYFFFFISTDVGLLTVEKDSNEKKKSVCTLQTVRIDMVETDNVTRSGTQ